MIPPVRREFRFWNHCSFGHGTTRVFGTPWRASPHRSGPRKRPRRDSAVARGAAIRTTRSTAGHGRETRADGPRMAKW